MNTSGRVNKSPRSSRQGSSDLVQKISRLVHDLNFTDSAPKTSGPAKEPSRPSLNLQPPNPASQYATEVPPDERILLPPTRTLSPFAEIYGVSNLAYWRIQHPDGISHSCVAPEYPSLSIHDVRGPPQKPNLTELPKPDDDALDKLFMLERDQSRVGSGLGGLKGWQLPIFNEGLYGEFSDNGPPSNDAPVLKSNWMKWNDYSTNLITVDESKWFRCYRRERWFDRRTNLLRSVRNPLPDLSSGYGPYPHRTWWSVDNPVIWQFVRLAIEIACRVLRQMCIDQDDWLDAFLCTDPIYTRDDSKTGGDKEKDSRPSRCNWYPRPKEHRATPDELLKRLEKLTSQPIFCALVDETTLGDLGLTSRAGGDMRRALILFNVGNCLRSLLELDTTVVERCRILCMFSIVILHESMHALALTHDNPEVDTKHREPFWDGEWIAELGLSFEKHVFGGVVSLYPGGNYVRGVRRGYFTHGGLDTFPSLHFYGGAGAFDAARADRKLTKPAPMYTIPTAWSTGMLCEKFWTDVVSVHGTEAFKPPRIITGVRANRYSLEDQTLSARLLEEPSFDHIPQLKPYCERLATRFQERQKEWDSLRPWYTGEYEKWQRLPWAQTPWFRDMLNTFIHFHAMRNLEECRTISTSCLLGIKNEIDHPQLPDTNSPYMLFAIISMMMIYSLPISPWEGRPKAAERSATLWPNSRTDPEWWTEWTRDLEGNPPPEETIGPFSFALPGDATTTKKGFNDHAHCMSLLSSMFDMLECERGAPISWLTGIVQCVREMSQERQQNPGDHTWTSFSFRIPKYGKYEQIWAVGTQYRGFGGPDDGRYWFPEPATFPNALLQSPTGSPVLQTKNIDSNASNDIIESPPRRHIYISDVANHRSLEDTWVVEPDGAFGFDVFDVTEILHSLDATIVDCLGIFKTTNHGWMLVDGVGMAEGIRSQLKVTIQPLGKLVLLKRTEEILEYNGLNGQPAWIIWKGCIYDVTDFPWKSAEERTQLEPSFGGPVSAESIASQERISDFEGRLMPYLCAHLDPPRSGHTSRIFTPKTLRWFDNPGVGTYIAVGDRVFDISTYLRFHPGGTLDLIQCAGQDATLRFEQFHHISLMDSYEDLQVGHLVPEILITDMDADHILIHDWIYDISPLAETFPDLYDALHVHGGTDVSAMLNGSENPIANILQLVVDRMQDLVVAGLDIPELPTMPAGELLKHNNHRSQNGAYVSSKGLVYNVSDLMMYPDSYEEVLDPDWAGREVGDSKLASWLSTNFSARCIARLVSGPAWPDSTMNLDISAAFPDPDAPSELYT
ncbi:hypothetical protein F4804DRAFT_291347 [Jackrogersella minutella]|nr:hypothetical protein F4804DRAFT_291347 [Jackrogersella minutella]